MIACADVLDWAAKYNGPRFHALLCDAPYEYGFMGKSWDASGVSYQAETWAALAEHLLPGAFGMTFGGARSWHRLAVAIEDAGLRIHPSIFGWAYGSGFPKATRIDTQVDKAAGAEREVAGVNPNWCENRKDSIRTATGIYGGPGPDNGKFITAPATDLARAWEGHRYGLQAMKPALEPIIVFQKPYEGKPVDCITGNGAGSLWIDGGRIGTDAKLTRPERRGHGIAGGWANYEQDPGEYGTPAGQGRWPANFTLCHSPLDDDDGCHESCAVRRLGEQSGERTGFKGFAAGAERKRSRGKGGYHGNFPTPLTTKGHNDKGTAARFFYNADWSHEIAEELAAADPVRYCAKAARKERDAGLEGFAPMRNDYQRESSGLNQDRPSREGRKPMKPPRNGHPTVKPIKLTQWLATLLLPPPEYAPRRILIPFAGVASEMIGAALAGWDEIVGIEMSDEYCEIARARLAHWAQAIEEPLQVALL